MPLNNEHTKNASLHARIREQHDAIRANIARVHGECHRITGTAVSSRAAAFSLVTPIGPLSSSSSNRSFFGEKNASQLAQSSHVSKAVAETDRNQDESLFRKSFPELSSETLTTPGTDDLHDLASHVPLHFIPATALLGEWIHDAKEHASAATIAENISQQCQYIQDQIDEHRERLGKHSCFADGATWEVYHGQFTASADELHPHLIVVRTSDSRSKEPHGYTPVTVFLIPRATVSNHCREDITTDANIRASIPDNYLGTEHAGMAARAKTLDQVRKYFMKLLQDPDRYTVIVAGHSLGGGVAQSFSRKLLSSYPASAYSSLRFHCWTFGISPIGDAEYWSQLEPMRFFFRHFVLEQDIIFRATLIGKQMFTNATGFVTNGIEKLVGAKYGTTGDYLLRFLNSESVQQAIDSAVPNFVLFGIFHFISIRSRDCSSGVGSSAQNAASIETISIHTVGHCSSEASQMTQPYTLRGPNSVTIPPWYQLLEQKKVVPKNPLSITHKNLSHHGAYASILKNIPKLQLPRQDIYMSNLKSSNQLLNNHVC